MNNKPEEYTENDTKATCKTCGAKIESGKFCSDDCREIYEECGGPEFEIADAEADRIYGVGGWDRQY